MRDIPKLRDLNHELIFELGLKHPSIQHALQQWKKGFITWEQAVYLMIWDLATSKEELAKQYIDVLTQYPLPFMVSALNVSKEVLSKIKPSDDM